MSLNCRLELTVRIFYQRGALWLLTTTKIVILYFVFPEVLRRSVDLYFHDAEVLEGSSEEEQDGPNLIIV